jgi:uncharacterized protein (TIGR03067 family)
VFQKPENVKTLGGKSLLVWITKLVGLSALLALTSSPVQAQGQEEIRKAIARGTAHLENVLASPKHPGDGQIALAALTLLECKVEPSEKVIQNAAWTLRRSSIRLTHTYTIALIIMFLDRLGEEDDDFIIEALTIRLLAGQNAGGGWSYHCAPSEAATATRLADWLERRQKQSEAPLARNMAPSSAGEILEQVERMRAGMKDLSNPGDNSNTQFATIALWIARRHSLPVEGALRAVERRFRSTQHVDGGWGYKPVEPAATASMTCAALLGLAVGHGMTKTAGLHTSPDKRPRLPGNQTYRADNDPLGDPAIYHGLQYLGRWMDSPLGPFRTNPILGLGETAQPAYSSGAPASVPRRLNLSECYAIWSLERVCAVYHRDTMGHQAWYDSGADLLLAAQGPDGSWDDPGFGGVKTSFALLFLSRSNLVKDLTEAIRGRIRGSQARLTSEVPVMSGQSKTAVDSEKGTGLPPGPKLTMPSAKGPDSGSLLDQERGEAAALAKELLAASPDRQTGLIERLRDGKGFANTDALALAISGLAGLAKSKAQDALVERLSRLRPSTLLDKLQDANSEVRRAAALACAMRGSKEMIPEIVKMLEDSEPRVGRAAHRALQLLTGKDFGPAQDAEAAERRKAAGLWKNYWAKESESEPDLERQSARESEQDRKLLEGDWILVSLESGGRRASKQAAKQLKLRIKFSGHEYALHSATARHTGRFALAANFRPKEIDLDNGKEISRGIYTIQGDKLKICFFPDGRDRPKDLVTRPLSGEVLWVLKRHNDKLTGTDKRD